MSNKNLIMSIRHACDEYKKRLISIEHLQSVLESNSTALEGLNNSQYKRIHNFSNSLEKIQFACPIERQYGEVNKIILEIEELLTHIQA